MLNKMAQNPNVIPLEAFRKPMKNPVLLELLAHWETLRGGHLAPFRRDVDPRAIENVLEYAFILEQPEVGPARFRIAGMRLCDLMGMELRAMPATSIIAEPCRARFAKGLARQFTTPEIVELTVATPCPAAAKNHSDGRADITGDMLLLPLKNDEGLINRILGCCVMEDRLFVPPQRLSITARKVTRIVTQEVLAPRHDHDHQRGRVNGFAEPKSAFIPATPAHLRLIDTGCDEDH